MLLLDAAAGGPNARGVEMFDPRKIWRAMVLAGVIATCVAPVASARLADGRSYAKPAGAPAAQQRVIVTPVAQPQDSGFDWSSAAIGAALPLVVVLFGLIGHTLVVHHRRGGAAGTPAGA
jgi:hypothetical protein